MFSFSLLSGILTSTSTWTSKANCPRSTKTSSTKCIREKKRRILHSRAWDIPSRFHLHTQENINKRHCSSSLFIFSKIIYFEKKNISFFCRFPYFSFLAGYHVEDYFHCFFIITSLFVFFFSRRWITTVLFWTKDVVDIYGQEDYIVWKFD